MLTLRRLTKIDEQVFLIADSEWETPDLAKRWFCRFDMSMPFHDIVAAYENEHNGINLPAGYVPCSVMYAFVDDMIVGRLSIRHRLTDALKRYGGHIGYAVNPPHRGKGYGYEMLKQAIEMAPKLCFKAPFGDLLLTVHKDNHPSIAIIKKCGGRLEDEFYDEEHKRITQRYVIEA